MLYILRHFFWKFPIILFEILSNWHNLLHISASYLIFPLPRIHIDIKISQEYCDKHLIIFSYKNMLNKLYDNFLYFTHTQIFMPLALSLDVAIIFLGYIYKFITSWVMTNFNFNLWKSQVKESTPLSMMVFMGAARDYG